MTAEPTDPVTIKKYANRRLYNTGTSSYVTLDDLATMVKNDEDFVVRDAKSGEDITHSVLTQIIFEQESKTGQTMLPVSVLRQLISFYGDQMQAIVPTYLEHSMEAFASQQEQIRATMDKAFSTNPVIAGMKAPLTLIEEQVRHNTEMFQKAMAVFAPPASGARKRAESDNTDLDALRRQLDEMQNKLDRMTRD